MLNFGIIFEVAAYGTCRGAGNIAQAASITQYNYFHAARFWVKVRGVSESAYIREQLSFEVKQRGAPKGTIQKKKVGRPKTKGKRPAAKTKEPLFKFVKIESGDSMFEKEKG